MNKFSAEKFYKLGQELQLLRSIATEFAEDKERDQVLELSSLAVLKDALGTALGLAKDISLKVTIRFIEGLIKSLDQPITYQFLTGELNSIRKSISYEMEETLFLYVPQDRAKYYSQPTPIMGMRIDVKFPSASYDVSEAAKCFALGRNTAAVCHLMRVLEIGLRSLSKSLKTPFEEKDWGRTLNQMQKEWNRQEHLKRKAAEWKRLRQFYSEAFVEFRYLKDAWRNHAMHALQKYDEEQAVSIYNHVEAFMNHLGTKLREAT